MLGQPTFEDLIIDVSRPVLDITNQNVQTLQIDAAADDVKAAIVTGNPLDDYNFIKRFPNMQLFQADSCGLSGFADLRLDLLPNLKVVILRLNRLRQFKNIRSTAALEVLDVSQNPFDIGAESTWDSAMENLKSIKFGFVSSQKIVASNYSYSITNVNTMQLFVKAFVSPFYNQEEIIFHTGGEARLLNILLTCSVNEQFLQVDVHRASDQPVRNYQVLVQAYVVITGFEITKRSEKQLSMKQFSNGVKIPWAEMDLNIQEYPTTQNDDDPLDCKIFTLLLNREQDQYAGKQNFVIVTVETMQRCAIFLADLKSHQFFDIQDQIDQIRKYVTAPETHKSLFKESIDLNENNPHFSVTPIVGCNIRVLGRPDVIFTDFYMTLKTRQQLAVEFQKAVFDQTGGERVDMERALELIDYATGQFARCPRQILEYQKKQYVILPLLQNGVEYTVNVEIGGKQRIQGNGAAYLNAVYAGRYLLADVSYSDYCRTTIMSSQPVKQQFNPHFRVQLEHQKPILIANVKEESDNGLRVSTYGYFQYEWIRNDQRLAVTNVPYLDMMTQQIHPNGMFKVRVQATDERGNVLGSAVESNGVFLRAETNQDDAPLYTSDDQNTLDDNTNFVVSKHPIQREFSAEPVEQTALADVKVRDWSEFAQK